MRVLMLGVMFAIAAFMPSAVNADDQQIADFIKSRLMQEKQQGNLYGFNVDMRVDRGTVWFKGFVANRSQELMILRTAQLAGHLGVVQVVDDIDVNGQTTAQMQPVPQAQQMMPPQRVAMRPEAYTQAPMGYQQGPANMMRRPVAPAPNVNLPQPQQPMGRPMTPGVRPSGMPLPMSRPGAPLSDAKRPKADENTAKVAYQEPVQVAPYRPTNTMTPSFQQSLGSMPAQTVSAPIGQPMAAAPPVAITGSPLPFARAAAPQGCMGGCAGGSMGPMVSDGYYDGGAGGISSDTASLPGYAWPSYAAHPNYGAVSYPKQYSASAWPYIGPFYPYPQVPLGWRKVSLEWDDGWWFLDFNDKN